MTQAAIHCKYVSLLPATPAEVPNGSMFLDSTNGNSMSVKTEGGVTESVNSAATIFFIKNMIAGAAITSGQPLSKRPDGKVIEADSDGVNAQTFIGFSQETVASDGDSLNVLLAGPNLSGVLSGLGMTSGQIVYLSESGGYTNDGNSFTGDNDTITKLGIADSGAGVANATAVDLIAITEVLITP